MHFNLKKKKQSHTLLRKMNYLGVCVYISIGIKRGEDVPIVTLGQSPDFCIIAGQQLMQDVHNSCRSNPFPGMNTTLDEDSGIIWLERELDAFDLTSLICFAAYDDLQFVRILLNQVVQVLVNFVKSMVAGEIERFRSCQRSRVVYERLNVLDIDPIEYSELTHYFVEFGQFVWCYHEIYIFAHKARCLPEREL